MVNKDFQRFQKILKIKQMVNVHHKGSRKFEKRKKFTEQLSNLEGFSHDFNTF